MDNLGVENDTLNNVSPSPCVLRGGSCLLQTDTPEGAAPERHLDMPARGAGFTRFRAERAGRKIRAAGTVLRDTSSY